MRFFMGKNPSQLVQVADCEVTVSGPTGSVKILYIPLFEVERGERVALFGPSGSGKSTFLHVLSGLLPVTSGTVTVADSRLDLLGEVERDRFRARSIGFVFQSFNLLQGLSALENVLLAQSLSGKPPDRKIAIALLEEVGLGHRLHNLPYRLSIGEQQRVAVARAMVHAPEIVLADEPTGSLDPIMAKEIMTLLDRMSADRGCTLIVVTHDQTMEGFFPRRVVFGDLNRAFRVDSKAGTQG